MREIYFEITQIGNSVKVVAIDPETGEEASIVAPANSPVQYLKSSAKRKLEYQIKKKKG